MTISIENMVLSIIRPTLIYLENWSSEMESLLVSTAKACSDLTISANDRTGLGIYCISSKTHKEVWDEYLAFRPDLASKIRGLASQHAFLSNPDNELIMNLGYATAISLAIYLRKGITTNNIASTRAQAKAWKACFAEAINQQEQDFIKLHENTIAPILRQIEHQRQVVAA